jgi:acetylornithine deacetylase
MRTRIEETVRAAAAGDDWLRDHPPIVSYDGFQTDGAIVSPDEPFIHALDRAYRTVMGKQLHAYVATAVNDMRYYLFQGVPSTCFGAAGGNMHAADEWLDLTSMVPAAKVIAAFVVDWCGVT